MTRKVGRPPLPRDGTKQQRLPLHATPDEYDAFMSALHADTRERFFQLDGAVTDYNIHVDEIAAERDELLRALRDVVELSHPDEVRAAFRRAQRILAQYEDNAVTGVTQEDSDNGN